MDFIGLVLANVLHLLGRRIMPGSIDLTGLNTKLQVPATSEYGRKADLSHN
jgi:hypothetical protein